MVPQAEGAALLRAEHQPCAIGQHGILQRFAEDLRLGLKLQLRAVEQELVRVGACHLDVCARTPL